MPRHKKNRIVQMAPHFPGFRPLGIPAKGGNEIVLNYEEYEALNLCDYELLTQAEAALAMQVSRPTFTRIYESVRRKIARAFMEGSCIRFEGGQVELARWYRCETCQISFTHTGEHHEAKCPFCGEGAEQLSC